MLADQVLEDSACAIGGGVNRARRCRRWRCSSLAPTSAPSASRSASVRERLGRPRTMRADDLEACGPGREMTPPRPPRGL